MYVLTTQIPIAKKNWRFCNVATDFEKDDGPEIAQNNIGKVLEKMAEWRSNHPRAFRAYPRYLKFFVVENHNPRFQKSRKVMEFNVWLDTGEVEIVG